MSAIRILKSEATGLAHVLGPGMRGLGAVGQHPGFPGQWAIAYAVKADICFESHLYPNREKAVAALLQRRGLNGQPVNDTEGE